MATHASMLDGALHSAFESGKCTAVHRDEISDLKSAFDAFAEAAVKLGKIDRSQYDHIRESVLPELAFVGDLEGCQGRMLLFLLENTCMDVVRLQGLESRPELNGRFGQLCGVLEPASGRWPIEVWVNVDGRVTGKKERLKLKTKSLRPAIMADMLLDMATAAKPNAVSATVVARASCLP